MYRLTVYTSTIRYLFNITVIIWYTHKKHQKTYHIHFRYLFMLRTTYVYDRVCIFKRTWCSPCRVRRCKVLCLICLCACTNHYIILVVYIRKCTQYKCNQYVAATWAMQGRNIKSWRRTELNVTSVATIRWSWQCCRSFIAILHEATPGANGGGSEVKRIRWNCTPFGEPNPG